jgi:4'-phosphopantetheinyl transferase EntD
MTLRMRLQALAEEVLHARFALAIARPQSVVNLSLFPIESAAITGARPLRQATFRAGRACARAALIELGFPPVAIPQDNSGAPVWPKGIVGSISHTNELAVAIVALAPPALGIGLDIEHDGALDEATCRPEEQLPGAKPTYLPNLWRGKIIFVIKEAVYKCYWPMTRTFLDFQDVRVSLDEPSSAFRAELRETAGPGVFEGKYLQVEGFVIAIAIPRGNLEPTFR